MHESYRFELVIKKIDYPVQYQQSLGKEEIYW